MVDDGMIADMVDVLHGAGKVRMFTDGDEIMVQMSDRGFSLMVYR